MIAPRHRPMEHVHPGLWPAAALLCCISTAPARADISDAVAKVDPAVVTLDISHDEGTGFVVNAAGEIVTNAHVIGKATAVQVKFRDGHSEKAKVVASDRVRDLALLRTDKPAARWAELGASSTLKPGEEVAAVGAPLGLEHSVTKGVVSAQHRRIGQQEFLQIDAPLNPGNSGGPVINTRGAVVGVSDFIARRAQNVGFAIPSEVLAAFLDEHGAKYTVAAGETLKPPTPSPSPHPAMPAPPAPELGVPQPGLPLTLALAAAVALVVSLITSVLVARLVARHFMQTRPLPVTAPIALHTPPQEDLSDIDVTLH